MTKERSSSIKRSQNSIVTLDREQSGLPTITLSERDWWFSEIDFSALVDEARNSRPSKASNKERQYRLAPGEERQGRRGCVGRVADGIRADLFFEYKVRAGRRWSYCYPVFMVDGRIRTCDPRLRRLILSLTDDLSLQENLPVKIILNQ